MVALIVILVWPHSHDDKLAGKCGVIGPVMAAAGDIHDIVALYADRIIKLCEAITEAYVNSGAGIPTETLLTKILLGTIGCAPAYDRYFKKALSITGAAPQSCNVRSLMALGKLYIDRKSEFEALRRHCSDRVEYPAAKVIDMCFFEYGFQNDGGTEE